MPRGTRNRRPPARIGTLPRLALGLLLLAPAAASSASAAGVEGGDRPPNVLLIVVDDLNDWVGHLGGHPGVKTPHIDRLASLGVSFTNAHAPAASCNPARVAVLSGLRPSTSGIYSNQHARLDALADLVTLPQYFRAHGYRVLGGGKILHSTGKVARTYFDEYFKRPQPLVKPERPFNGKKNLDWHPLDAAEREMPDHQVVSWAVDKLAEEREEPLFLAVGIVKPHLPWYVPEEYFAMYPEGGVALPRTREDDLDDVPPPGMRLAGAHNEHRWILDNGKWADAVRGYLATVSFVDRQVGRLMEGLRRSGKDRNTIVLLWSDHGMHLGEKLHWKKSSLWEEATRTPLVVVAPGVSRAGGRIGRPVDALSIYPTLADLAGLPIPEHVEGPSLKRLVADPGAPWDGVALTTHGRGNHAVRSERWRYIRYADGSEELYDHEDDPMEWDNLADVPGLATVKRDLAAWMPVEEAPVATMKRPARSRVLVLDADQRDLALFNDNEKILFVSKELRSVPGVRFEIHDLTEPSRPPETSAGRLGPGGRWGFALRPEVEPDSMRRFDARVLVEDGEGNARLAAARQFIVDGAAPSITVDTPAGAVFSDSLRLSGTVRDNHCLAWLQLEISDQSQDRARYWDGDRWQASVARVTPTLDRPDKAASGWRYRLSAPLAEERHLKVQARAADCAGNRVSASKRLRSYLPQDHQAVALRAASDGYLVDREDPVVAISTPPAAVFGDEIRISGEARDELCVADVRLTISAAKGSRFWDGERWRGTPVSLGAELDRRRAPATSWRYSFAPPFESERRFRVRVKARDCANNSGTGLVKLWSFAARELAEPAGFVVDAQPPEVEIASPPAAVLADRVRLSGVARDDVCVAQVELRITDRRQEPRRYWNGEEWQDAPAILLADLESRGSIATEWDYLLELPPEARGIVIVRAQARDCARNRGQDSAVFRRRGR